MKKLIIYSLILLSANAFSQEKDTTYWKNSFKAGLTFNQVSFSENWKAGGNNSVSIGALMFGKAIYQKEKIEWVNKIDFQYGKIKNEGQGVRKSVDKLAIETKLGYRVNKTWNIYSSLSLLSQFDDGYSYPAGEDSFKISGMFAPAYITSSWGAEYKPNDFFYVRISPFSPRITIVNDTALYNKVPENYGVIPGETVRYEWKAFKLTANFEKNLVDNISLKADYELFANMEDLTLNKIDHRLDLIITAKIYKFLNLTLTSNLLKDIDQIDLVGDPATNQEPENKWQASYQIGLSFLIDYTNQK